VSTRDDLPTPAEQHVTGLLAQLATDHPEAPPTLPGSVVATARWQRAVSLPLRTVGGLAAALAEGVALALGLRSGGGGR
jgi:hypothetical protein